MGRTPPGPPPSLRVWSRIRRMQRDPLGMLDEVAGYGPIAYVRIGAQPIYVVSDPAWIERVLITDARCFAKGRALERSRIILGNGLLTSHGEFHLRQRRLVQPAFHRARVDAYAQTMIRHALGAREQWVDGETFDIARAMNRLTLSVVADTLFSTNVENDAEAIAHALTDVVEMFGLTLVPGAELLVRLPLPSMRRFRRAIGDIDRVLYRIITSRRGDEQDRGDLLSMLLMARDTERDGGGMTDQQLRDEAVTLFLAGHETTANALTWTWRLLAENPDAEARLHDEIDRVIGDREPQPGDVPALTYTRMVLAESMRLYPPAWTLGRRALEPYDLAGYRLPRGALVLMSQWVMHRDARFWPDPLRFEPIRFTPDAQRERPRFAYFPFGAGNRVCIGEAFAWTEGILLLATIAQRWRFSLVDGHPIVLHPLITLRARHGIAVRAHRRHFSRERAAQAELQHSHP